MNAWIGRRSLIALALGAGAAGARAAPVRRAVAFEIWRGGVQIGSHGVSFTSRGDQITASIAAAMRVKLGPVPIFTYRHEAVEVWEGDSFVSLVSRSVSNGRMETVDVRRTAAGLTIVHDGRPLAAAVATALPLTHWNRAAFKSPLFNPQTGAAVRCSVARRDGETVRYADGRSGAASAIVLSGDADIVDWYDESGAWAGLKARGPDGSTITYRRV